MFRRIYVKMCEILPNDDDDDDADDDDDDEKVQETTLLAFLTFRLNVLQ